MASTGESRYGRTIYLPPQPDARAIPLRRRRLTTEPGDAPYDEDWLQQLLWRTPGLLPIGEIDAAFAPAIPLCCTPVDSWTRRTSRGRQRNTATYKWA